MLYNKKIDNGKGFDWGLTSSDYAKFRDIYPQELYDRLSAMGVAADNSSWLDLGTGTGILPQNLYNEKARITAVDITEEQINYARLKAEENGWNIDYLVSPAESTGLPDNSFDCITAAQCFWYFEREKIISEIRRMLKPGGKFIKVYLAYTLDDEIAKTSHELVKKMNKNWTPGASGAKDMFDDLFPNRETESFYCDLPFTRKSWHGRMCACRGTLASMDEKSFAKWNKKHIKFLETCPEEFTIRHKLYISSFTVE